MEFLQQIINGLALGSVYALLALGYTMVYGIIQLINFAHGEIYMIGAFSGLLLCFNIKIAINSNIISCYGSFSIIWNNCRENCL